LRDVLTGHPKVESTVCHLPSKNTTDRETLLKVRYDGFMTSEARALARVLVYHHSNLGLRAHGLTDIDPDPFLITRRFMSASGRPFSYSDRRTFPTRSCSMVRGEWLAATKSLAVNRETRRPGEGYDNARGCNLVEWHNDVIRCITYDRYPEASSIG